MKHKKLNFRVTDDFDVFLESMWRTQKYQKIGIKTKSDLIRYGVLKAIGIDYGIDLLKQFENVDEINRYLNPKSSKKTNKINDELNDYLQKRKSGEIKFEKDSDH